MITLSLPILTREIIEDCLINSPLFRAAVIDNLILYSKPNLHIEIVTAMKDSVINTGSDSIINKIAFVKRIREISDGRCLEISVAYPEIIRRSEYLPPLSYTMLTLNDSKNLAEYYITTFKV